MTDKGVALTNTQGISITIPKEPIIFNDTFEAIIHMKQQEKPNFLQYLLLLLSEHRGGEYSAIKKCMEEKYGLTPLGLKKTDTW
jgi:hypothetical protein